MPAGVLPSLAGTVYVPIAAEYAARVQCKLNSCACRYVPNMCMVGWFLVDAEGSTKKERFADLMMVAVLETMVASAALIYCMYMMPLFYMLSAWGQLAW